MRLLGARTIHVSIFISVEFPDKNLISFLKQYGQLKTDNLRRLYYSDEGYENIERGIRVSEFVSLDRDLPRKLVTQGFEIFFKYSGQPVSCYRCGSTDHIVKDCPRQRRARPREPRAPESRGDTAADQPTPSTPSETAMDTEISPTTDPSPSSTSATQATPTSQPTPSASYAEAANATQELFTGCPTEPLRKRAPSSPAKGERPTAKKSTQPSPAPPLPQRSKKPVPILLYESAD